LVFSFPLKREWIPFTREAHMIFIRPWLSGGFMVELFFLSFLLAQVLRPFSARSTDSLNGVGSLLFFFLLPPFVIRLKSNPFCLCAVCYRGIPAALAHAPMSSPFPVQDCLCTRGPPHEKPTISSERGDQSEQVPMIMASACVFNRVPFSSRCK